MLSSLLKKLKNRIKWEKSLKELRGKTPNLTKKITDKVNLELYVTESSSGPNTWCIAVISIQKDWYIRKIKFDGGRIISSIEEMANQCEIGFKKFGKEWFDNL